MSETEQSLSQRLISGEAEAFNEVVRLYHSSLFRLAKRLLRNEADAQEVVQDSFLAAFEGRKRFAGRAKIRTWLLSIAYNKAVDRLKAVNKDNWAIQGSLQDSNLWEKVTKVQHITDWRANPEQSFEQEELVELLQKALKEVPAESKAAFELQDIQGLNSREVAETLGISEGAARVRVHRVRQYLMAALQDLDSNQRS